MADERNPPQNEQQGKADRVAQNAVERLRRKGFSDQQIQEAIDGKRKLGDG